MIWPLRTASGRIRPRTPVVAMTMSKIRTEHAPGARMLEQTHDADSGGAEPDLADDAVVRPPPGPAHGVQHRGEHHDGGAVLVVMQHRPRQARLQTRLDLEAGRCRKILELDRAESRGDRCDVIDATRRIRLIEQDRHGMDSDQRREQRRLALHDGQPRERADIAEPEYGRAVGHDRDRVAEA